MQIILAAEGGQRDELGAWFMSKFPGISYEMSDPYVAIACYSPHGKGVVVYHSYRPYVPDIHLDAAGEGLWITRESLRVYFDYPFIQLGCRRITTLIAKNNRPARRLNEKLGFVSEGVLREGMPGGHNAIVYGMLRRECRWLGSKVHEQAA